MKKIGQVRILEATLALIVVTLSIVFVNSYYKSIIGSEANQDLSDIAYEILYSLNERELLAPYIYNENSKMLEATIASALSNRYAFKLTVYKIEEEEFKETLKNLANETADKLAKKLSINETKNIKNSLKTQIKSHLLSYFQVYWVMLPWCKEGKIQDLETVFNEYKTLVGETELYQIIKLISEHTYYKPVNVGIVYSLLLELSERLLSARKGIRNTFITSAYTQEGEKCTLCGEFNELWLLDCEPNLSLIHI